MAKGGGHTSDFSSHTLQSLKDMVRDAQPDKVEEIAHHWMQVHDQMAGDAPDGSVRDLLDKAVADVMEYWHGDAADAFSARAKRLSANLGNGALYAKNTSNALKHAAVTLRETQRAVTALQDTEGEMKDGNIITAGISYLKDGADKVGDYFSRDDSGLKQDVSKGTSAGDALSKHADSLSRGREIALQAAAKMEQLGASYNVQAARLAKGPWVEEGKHVRPPDESVPPPVVTVAGPLTSGGPRRASQPSLRGESRRASSNAPTPQSPHTPGASGSGGGVTGSGDKAGPSTAPRPGTALDGVRGGVATPVNPPPSAQPSGVIGSGVPAGSGPTVPGVPAVPPGGRPVSGGRLPRGGTTARPGVPGAPGTAPGTRTPPGAGRSTATGMPGQPGTGRPAMGAPGGPAASGTGRGSAGGRQGGLARRGGGVVGEPSKTGTPGRGAQGGSGLHRSRGGALGSRQGATTPRSGGPMVPPQGRSSRDENRRKGTERPDYLVEDEETWVSQRDVVPGVVGESAPASPPPDAAVERQEQEPESGNSEGNNKA